LQLNSDENELIYLREYEGYSYKEIAELTEQSLENIKIKIFRVRKKLREILK
jgi:RNA polymerase sigma-70 factor (ECF subfamily)